MGPLDLRMLPPGWRPAPALVPPTEARFLNMPARGTAALIAGWLEARNRDPFAFINRSFHELCLAAAANGHLLGSLTNVRASLTRD